MLEEHYQIGTVAETVGLSLRTIRYYEEIGLVSPSGRTDGGFRLYTEADIERLHLVKALKPVGMSLETMGTLLERADALEVAVAAGDGVEDAARAFERVLETAHRHLEEWQERLEQARTALAGLDRLAKTGDR
ncbi:MAG: MerR family transcriptional regulator [Acidimicrobiia bacterium]